MKSAPAGGRFHGGCAPIFFLRHQKENGRTRSKEKMFRRVGPHTCGPPAAGGGRLAVPRGNQGRKRAALGVIQAWGSLGYRQRRFYPQGVRRIRKAAEPPTAAQLLRAARVVVGAYAGGRMRASAPTTWTMAFGVPEKWMAFRILAKGNGFPHPRKNGCPSAFPQKAMVFRIPGKTNALPHSHKRRWLSASPEKQMPFRIPTKGDGFPHPRKNRCPSAFPQKAMAFRIPGKRMPLRIPANGQWPSESSASP